MESMNASYENEQSTAKHSKVDKSTDTALSEKSPTERGHAVIPST